MHQSRRALRAFTCPTAIWLPCGFPSVCGMLPPALPSLRNRTSPAQTALFPSASVMVVPNAFAVWRGVVRCIGRDSFAATDVRLSGRWIWQWCVWWNCGWKDWRASFVRDRLYNEGSTHDVVSQRTLQILNSHGRDGFRLHWLGREHFSGIDFVEVTVYACHFQSAS
jgi:hypothetical protein